MIAKLTDLPGLTGINIMKLAGMGITSVSDLAEAITDDRKVKRIISSLSGIGPNTINAWKMELNKGTTNVLSQRQSKPNLFKFLDQKKQVNSIKSVSLKDCQNSLRMIFLRLPKKTFLKKPELISTYLLDAGFDGPSINMMKTVLKFSPKKFQTVLTSPDDQVPYLVNSIADYCLLNRDALMDFVQSLRTALVADVPTKIITHPKFGLCRQTLDGKTIYSGEMDILLHASVDLQCIEISNNVKTIGDHAFEGCNLLESVDIPSGVQFVGEGAFKGCTSLTGIQFPDSVISIENDAFKDCISLKNVTFPGNMIEIKPGAFENCRSLRSIVFPKGVCYIADRLFAGCISLNDITLPDDVEELCSFSFYNCFSLKEVSASRIRIIGDNAFENCKKLEDIDTYSLEEIGDYAFRRCSSLTAFIGYGFLSYIGVGAFQGCSRLQCVDLSGCDVEYLEDSVFEGCVSLSEITLPEFLVSIGDSTFKGCHSIDDIDFRNRVESIGPYAFCDCTHLRIIYDIDNINEIGGHAFENCFMLLLPAYLESYGTNTSFLNCFRMDGCGTDSSLFNSYGIIDDSKIGSIIDLNEYYSIYRDYNDYDIDYLLYYAWERSCDFACCFSRSGGWFRPEDGYYSHEDPLPDYINRFIEQNVTSCVDSYGSSLLTWIDDNDLSSFDCDDDEYVTLKRISFEDHILIVPDGIEVIEEGAFSGNNNLLSVYMSDSVLEIRDGAFSNCINLEDIVLSNRVEYIGRDAFNGCSSLKSIIIPNSVAVIEDGAFDGCISLKEITLSNPMSEINEGQFRGLHSLETMTIHSPITRVGSEAFKNCTSLKEINLPDSVTVIDSGAFEGCISLEEITLPRSISQIEYDAFWGCDSMKVIVPAGVKIPDDVYFQNVEYISPYSDGIHNSLKTRRFTVPWKPRHRRVNSMTIGDSM